MRPSLHSTQGRASAQMLLGPCTPAASRGMPPPSTHPRAQCQTAQRQRYVRRWPGAAPAAAASVSVPVLPANRGSMRGERSVTVESAACGGCGGRFGSSTKTHLCALDGLRDRHGCCGTSKPETAGQSSKPTVGSGRRQHTAAAAAAGSIRVLRSPGPFLQPTWSLVADAILLMSLAEPGRALAGPCQPVGFLS